MKRVKAPKIAIAILIFILLITFLGPFIYQVSPYEFNKDAILAPPSLAHPFGTDRLGRDLLARVIKGGQISIIIGVGSAVIASLIGLIYGVIAGYFKGWWDKSFVFIVDLFLTFPTFFLLLTLVSYIEASSLILIVVIAITGWMGTARLIRSQSYQIASKPFIKILKVAKVPTKTIIFKYFLPLLGPIFFVSFSFGVSGAILAESGLSYLGLGITPPNMSWGSILSDGKSVMEIAWWVSFFPGLFLFLVTFSLIQISDYLQELSNVKEKI
ncbi:MAG: ABC transporter permease [Epsilonproteobacteria bacterium]|nr:ABC transporter permease [Campylobacterota bacterium]